MLRETDISPDLYVVADEEPDPSKKCSCYSAKHLARVYDVVCLNLPRFPEVPRSEPLVKRPPWEFEEKLLVFKREYCRRNHVECSFFNEDEDWPERQIVDTTAR